MTAPRHLMQGTTARHLKMRSMARLRRRIGARGVVIGVIVALAVSGMASALLSNVPSSQTAAVTARSISAATGFTHGTIGANSTTLTWTAPVGYTPTNWTITQTSPSGTVSGTCAGSEPASGCTVTGLSPSIAYTWSLTYFFNSWQATTTTIATTTTPAITLGTTSGVTVGSTDTVSGTGFPASSTVTLSWDGAGVPITTTTTSASGAFGPTSFTIPQAVAGSRTVGAAAGNGYATASVTVVPKITVNSWSVLGATTASVSGTGFAAGSTISATFNGSNVTLTAPSGSAPQTDAFGSFNDAGFTITQLTTGNYNLIVKDGSSNTAPTFSFAETSNGTYTSTTSGLTATQAATTMSGLINIGGPCTNCAKAETFNVYVDGIPAIGQVTTSSSKTWNTGNGEVTGFGLPAGIVSGTTHSVTIIDSSGLVYGTASLSLTGFLTPSPATGAPRTSVTVTGAAHTISASGVTFSTFFDSTALVTGTTSTTNGATSSPFTVPGGWGTHLIYLEQTNTSPDVGYFTPAVTFTVPEPTMTATPTGGFASGHTVTLAGSGFAGSTTLGAIYAGSLVSLTSGTTIGNGSFSGVTFTLPTETADTYPLVVTDSMGSLFIIAINQTG